MFWIVLLSLFCFTITSWAHPRIERRNSPLEISNTLLETLELFQNYAAASYCPRNTLASTVAAKLTCLKANNCPHVEKATTSILLGIKDAPLTDVTGFVATDETNKLTVIAFQGTETDKQIKVDLNLSLMNASGVCSGCMSHSGFWQSWQETRPKVLEAITNAQKKFPKNKIIATGHSLGGAIATIAVADLRSNGIPVDLYSFGAPRIGNQLLADYIQNPKKELGANFRVTHYNDPVPRLPPAFMGYAHYVPEIYISSKNGKAVTLAEILQLDATSISKGNEQFMMVDVAAHRWYFNAISACYEAVTRISNTTEGNDLGTLWAGTVVQVSVILGNNSLSLVGGRTTPALVAGTLAGLIATMSNDAGRAVLNSIPGGFLAIPFLPNNGFLGGITSTTIAGIIEMAIASGLISLNAFNGTIGSSAASPTSPNPKLLSPGFSVADHM